MPFASLRHTVQRNCDISDASSSSSFSLCTLFLRLRNFFKWENGVEPWHEPESAELLAWIAAKEAHWHSVENSSLSPLPVNGSSVDPFVMASVNEHLEGFGLFYGAGYGRSMKPIFFLAERLEDTLVQGCRTLVLGRELARELAAPFAMLQDEVIYLRKEPLRFFLWDHITDIRPSGKRSLQYSLQLYDLLNRDGQLDRARLQEKLDEVVELEMMAFIYHEVGELQETALDRELFKKLLAAFGGSSVELLARAVKDVLADTHPHGMLSYILAEKKNGSLGFYVTFLDGLRKMLFPEINEAFRQFMVNGDWGIIRRARDACRRNTLILAGKLTLLGQRLETEPLEAVKESAERHLLGPLGL